jgi:hypothetical protein
MREASSGRSDRHVSRVHAVVDVQVQEDWKESKARPRVWLASRDAAALIDEPELAALLSALKADNLVSAV